MKTILIVTVFLASLVPAFAQTQEAKLLDRIQKPNMELGNPMQSKSFSGTSSVPIRASPQAQEGFYGVKDANTKAFPLTRSFLGLKNPWFGEKVYSTKETAAISSYDVKRAAASDKTTEVDGYYKATQAASLGSPVVPLTTFVPEPAAGGAVSRISDKINQKMTIDEVRELLNKPR